MTGHSSRPEETRTRPEELRIVLENAWEPQATAAKTEKQARRNPRDLRKRGSKDAQAERTTERKGEPGAEKNREEPEAQQ